jgi:hypothetical protein
MHYIKEISFSYANVQLLEPKLVRVHVFRDIVLDMPQAREVTEAIGMLTDGREALIILRAHPAARFTPEAMKFSSSEEGL